MMTRTPRGHAEREPGAAPLLAALRIVSVIAAIVFAGGVLRDPYTMHMDGSDFMRPAPWWHVAIAFADWALLAAFAAAPWRWTGRTTLALLLGETLLNVGATLAYVYADGMSRFVFGFASQSFLAGWLALVAGRVLLALAWALALPRES
jgi:hypothetical protein